MTNTPLTEAGALVEAPRGTAAPSGRRQRIRLITPGWGSSGYYPAPVLEQAAKDRVFAAGTRMFLDHPLDEEVLGGRPERSLRDLAAVLVTNAIWDPDAKALFAEAQVFEPFRAALAEQAPHIGVSIRAAGSGEYGEAEGRKGLIINRIVAVESVDFVTAAGRGGAIVSLLESARARPTDLAEARNVGAWLEARLHTRFTEMADDMYGGGRLTREERIGLSSAIGDALSSFVTRIESDHPQLYERDLWDEPTSTDAVTAVSESEPGRPATSRGAVMSGSSTTGPGTNAPGTQPPTPTEPAELVEARRDLTTVREQLAEARQQLATIGENAQRTATAERQLAEARSENQRLRGVIAARAALDKALAESGLPEVAWPRVTATVIGADGAGIPLTEAGAVDEDKLGAAITAAIGTEKSYIAGLAEAAGTGVPRGLGATDDTALSEADLEKELAESFRGLGMSESAATVAAKGR